MTSLCKNGGEEAVWLRETSSNRALATLRLELGLGLGFHSNCPFNQERQWKERRKPACLYNIHDPVG